MVDLGTKKAALIAQRKLAQTSSDLASVYERLASGLRINRASDDPAGLAMAESLKSNRRVFNQGVRNLNDGISLLNVADSALESLTNVIQRIEELAAQAANGTLSVSQRKALDKEAQSLSAEFTRIIRSTEYNGRNLFSRNFGTLSLQAGFSAISSTLGGKVGDGTFFPRVSIDSGTDLHQISAHDFNGDGIMDLAYVAVNMPSVMVQLGTGGGAFGAMVTYSLNGGEPLQVKAADVNNDGIFDLLTADRNTDNVSVLLGNGNGTFKAQMTVGVGNEPGSISTGDFNNDGLADFVVGDAASTFGVWLSNGNGTFTQSHTLTMSDVETHASIGDVNGDGILDVVATSSFVGSEIKVFLGHGNGTFNSGTQVASPGTFESGAALHDFNGDGKLDIVSADRDGNSIRFYIGQGDGTFTYSASYASSLPILPVAGDFNGDGHLDVVVSNRFSDELTYYLNQGNGTFSAAQTISTGLDPLGVTVADINGDGVDDILAPERLGFSIGIFTGRTTDGVGPIRPFTLTNLADAREALSILKTKREVLALQRGQIGAFQSRTEFASNHLATTADLLAAAESRIRDVDVAAEVSKMVRLQILQQAGGAILAQANVNAKVALKLLS